MVVEDAAAKSSTSTTLENPNPNPNPNLEDDEPEEGEIVGVDDDSSKPSKGAIAHQPHPLEHSWTFWFDGQSAKSKQAAWGTTIRPIYTFTTVEEFWGYFSCFCSLMAEIQ